MRGAMRSWSSHCYVEVCSLTSCGVETTVVANVGRNIMVRTADMD